MHDPPILINVRDRVTALTALVAWLERAGHERIVLIDNDSTWPPLLDYLRATPHEVIRLKRNAGSRAIWYAGLDPSHERYVYTDPDLVPTDDCPLDAVTRLSELLDRHPDFPKAGLGLYLDDVPLTMNSLAWERSLVDGRHEIEAGVHGSDCMIDTTFALYRPSGPFGLRAIRTGAPYQMRHLPWYATELSDEDRHYLGRATSGPLGSSWAAGHQRAA